MKSKTNLNYFIFYFFCMGSWYSYGTAMMDYFLVYPSRYLINEADFINYHHLLEKAILPISVFPFLLVIILNIVLLWVRPAGISLLFIRISLLLLLIDLASTILFQAPWNMQLSNGKNVELMNKITQTNWIRVILETAQAMVAFTAILQTRNLSQKN